MMVRRPAAMMVLVAAAAACGADEHVAPVDAMVPIDSFEEGDGCASEVPCPPPGADAATICGRLFDPELETFVPLATSNVLAPCTGDPATEGPCSLSVRFVDALDLAADPVAAQALVPEGGVYVDGCGRYRGVNIPHAPSGTIAVVVDDAPGVADRHRVTAVAVANDAASPVPGFRAYATRIDTDTAWSTPVFGEAPTFAERGVVVMAFTYKGVPQRDVQARRDGALVPDDDHYFADNGIARTTISASATATGDDGSALVVGSSGLTLHDGIGGEPPGCLWPTRRAVATPGVVSVQLVEAEASPGAPCP